jgi:hypothetical protein
MYSIDLGKMDGVKEIFYREPENWNLLDEEDSDEDMDDDDEDDEDDDMDEEEGDSMAIDTPPAEATVPSVTQEMEQLEVEEQEPTVEDSRPLPRPFESLREFFSRTADDWQQIGIEALTMKGLVEGKTIKELRKAAFEMAEEKWWDSREEIMALEDEQEEAGIGEVVSMAERAENAGGAGRRR